MDEGAPIYIVKNKDGEQKKAMDLVALKQFLERKKQQFSVLNINPDNVDDEAKLQPQIASAAMNIIMELEDAVDESLGLKQEDSGGEQSQENAQDNQPEDTGETAGEASEAAEEPAPEATDQPQSGEPEGNVDESRNEIVL